MTEADFRELKAEFRALNEKFDELRGDFKWLQRTVWGLVLTLVVGAVATRYITFGGAHQAVSWVVDNVWWPW